MFKLAINSIKKYLKITTFIFVASFIALISSNVSAFDYDTFMKPIDEDITNTGTSGRITQPIRFESEDVEKYSRTNPLALAICKADHKRLRKFLMIITNPCDPNFMDINSPALFVQGFRQAYNLVSLAADPIWPFKERHSLQKRLKIIDLLATTSINFNFRPIDAYGKPKPPFHPVPVYEEPAELQIFSHCYESPLRIARSPMHGDWMGVFNEKEEEKNGVHDTRIQMQARVLLYGGDPLIGGTCAYTSIHEKDMQAVVRIACQQLMNDKSLFRKIRPTDSVSTLLADPYLTQAKEKYAENLTKKVEELSKIRKNEEIEMVEKILERIKGLKF